MCNPCDSLVCGSAGVLSSATENSENTTENTGDKQGGSSSVVPIVGGVIGALLVCVCVGISIYIYMSQSSSGGGGLIIANSIQADAPSEFTNNPLHVAPDGTEMMPSSTSTPGQLFCTEGVAFKTPFATHEHMPLKNSPTWVFFAFSCVAVCEIEMVNVDVARASKHCRHAQRLPSSHAKLHHNHTVWQLFVVETPPYRNVLRKSSMILLCYVAYAVYVRGGWGLECRSSNALANNSIMATFTYAPASGCCCRLARVCVQPTRVQPGSFSAKRAVQRPAKGSARNAARPSPLLPMTRHVNGRSRMMGGVGVATQPIDFLPHHAYVYS